MSDDELIWGSPEQLTRLGEIVMKAVMESSLLGYSQANLKPLGDIGVQAGMDIANLYTKFYLSQGHTISQKGDEL